MYHRVVLEKDEDTESPKGPIKGPAVGGLFQGSR